LLIDDALWGRFCVMASRFDQLDINVKWGLGGNSAKEREDPLLLMCLKKALN
jgi:hypothetical protein